MSREQSTDLYEKGNQNQFNIKNEEKKTTHLLMIVRVKTLEEEKMKNLTGIVLKMRLRKVGVALETGKSLKKAMNEKRNIEFCIDSGKPNNYSDASMASDSSNTSVNNVLNHQQLSAISKAQQKSLDVEKKKEAEPLHV
ncbi:hypothetical protein Tco_1180759 [Tanacetum coccineum]